MHAETYEHIHKAVVALWNDVMAHFFQKEICVQSLPKNQLGIIFHLIPLQMSLIIYFMEINQKVL